MEGGYIAMIMNGNKMHGLEKLNLFSFCCDYNMA
jgi:hypothetical protein